MIKKTKNNISSLKSPLNAVNDDVLISVLQKLPVGVVIFTETNLLFINSIAINIFKPTKEFQKTLKNHSIYDFLLPEFHKLIKKNNLKIYKGQESIPFELQIKNEKNEIIHLQVKSNAIFFNNKNAIQTIITDISKQVNTKSKLSLSEKKYKLELEQKWANYHNLLESSPIGIFIHRNGICLYCNKAAQNILEEKDRNKVIGSNLINDIIPSLRKTAIQRINKAIKGEVQKDLVYKIKTRLNNIIEVDLKTVPFIYNGEQCVQTIISNVSIEKKLIKETERAKIAERENKILVKAINDRNSIQAKLNTIFNTSTHIIWIIDCNYNLITFNTNYYNQIINTYNKSIKEGDSLKKVYKNDYAFWENNYKKAFKGQNVFFEIENKTKTGTFVYHEVYLNPTFNDKGKVIEIVALSHNITERKENEIKAREQAAKLNAIFESGDQLIWTVNENKKLTSFNQNYAASIHDVFNFYPQIGQSVTSTKVKKYNLFWEEKYDYAFSGKKIEFTSEIVDEKGNKIIRQIILYPIKDNKNKVLEVSGIGFDITDNKINEDRITQSLKEKEVLLKEVHHRVKNNMQVISSILNLQSSYVKDKYAFNLLKECQNRIKSMAFIHESLYRTKNFEFVNFSEYVTTLSKNLIHSYSLNSKKVKLLLSLDKLTLNLDASIPCGLIINEIISNSLKYAFPDNRDGIIFVTLKADKNKVTIEVGDNGIGIPGNIDIKYTETLGLQLVDTLIEQINGSIKLDRKKGTKFIVTFNL